MSYIMIDIESDGPIPGDYSMISFGAVIVNKNLSKTFYGKLKPISDKYIDKALEVSGLTREQTLSFDDPKETLLKFEKWIKENCIDKPIFISDNNGFDWMFICWYFHHFLERNPFGFSSMNLGSFYKGLIKNVFENFKHLRKTQHTHNPVDDAIGNAEAFLTIIELNNIKIKL
jgi:DNA polymerase III alpha subunit (gram-positive type)